jgi:diketogulonate reductase-like aldo/keto reductase
MVPNYKLDNGVEIPKVGFGTWQIPDGADVENAVFAALECGYNHIDTAYAYYNEKGVGAAVKRSGIPREELFITTKLWNTEQGYAETLENFELSLENLGTDYLDLYLIHWPQTFKFFDEYPQRMWDTWRAFEELYQAGRVRAIGLSNFLQHHIEKLMEKAAIPPMVDQLEIHPGYNQDGIVDYCREKGIVVESWSPLANGKLLAQNAVLAGLAEKYGKSVAQVALRWNLQRGLLPLPRSVTPARIAENFDIFGFELEQEDMQRISGMPESYFSGYHPDHVEFLEGFG